MNAQTLLYVKYLAICIACFVLCYWLWKRFIVQAGAAKRVPDRRLSSLEQYGVEYQKLLTAVFNDHRVAARLINDEHSKAGPAGVGKAEAVRRALERLTHDRSRGHWR